MKIVASQTCVNPIVLKYNSAFPTSVSNYIGQEDVYVTHNNLSDSFSKEDRSILTVSDYVIPEASVKMLQVIFKNNRTADAFLHLSRPLL